MTIYKAFAPNGQEITGTLETVLGTAEIDHFIKNDEGNFDHEYGGYTDVHWDSQRSFLREGSKIYVTEDRSEWLIGQLRFEEIKEEGDSEGQPGPTYSVWISEPVDSSDGMNPIWRWQHEQDFTCTDDPEGRGARASAHGYARYLRRTYPASLVAVRPAGKAPKDAFL